MGAENEIGVIGRIARKAEFVSLKARIRSFEKLQKLSDRRGLDDASLEAAKQLLSPHYQRYINEVSQPDMCASLELSSFVYSYCKANNCRKVMDVGSGFTSFCLRLYAADSTHPVEVISTDDHAVWLEKTKEFITSCGLEASGLVLFKDFLQQEYTGFDLVINDFNFVEERIRYTDHVMNLVARGGIALFDDVHKPDYLHPLLRQLKQVKADLYALAPVTMDRYGRYALAVVKSDR